MVVCSVWSWLACVHLVNGHNSNCFVEYMYCWPRIAAALTRVACVDRFHARADYATLKDTQESFGFHHTAASISNR